MFGWLMRKTLGTSAAPLASRRSSGGRGCRFGRHAFEPLEPRLALDSTVVFNEIMYNPPGDTDASLEWVELYNQMAVDMDLSRWSI